LDNLDFESQNGEVTFLLFKPSRPTLGPIHFSVQLVWGLFSRGKAAAS